MISLTEFAIAYARNGWDVFPLARQSKIPALPHAHRCRGHVGAMPCCARPLHQLEHQHCKGECGVDGHGVLDATSDTERVARWWAADARRNIGGRLPDGVLVIDVDPRHDGLQTLAALELAHGPLPVTRTAFSGRGDGGRHLYWQHPGGEVTSTNLGAGLDVKTHTGYCVLPPSIHPDSGQPYRWSMPVGPIAAMPAWLAELLHPRPPAQPHRAPRPASTDDDSIADWYSATRSWHDVLAAHGWYVVRGDGDEDGSSWRHPTATSKVSATVRHGCLFVYSPTPGLPVTEACGAQGLTRFRAFAHLEHDGDLRAAGRAARRLRDGGLFSGLVVAS